VRVFDAASGKESGSDADCASRSQSAHFRSDGCWLLTLLEFHRLRRWRRRHASGARAGRCATGAFPPRPTMAVFVP